MLQILNHQVYDLKESVIASGNAMRIKPADVSEEEFIKGLERMKRLVYASKNSDVHCHDNALSGIRVSFDIIYPQYWSMEAQRYHFLDIVTSSSKMHRLCRMDLNKSCNEYVDQAIIDILNNYIRMYNEAVENQWQSYDFTKRDRTWSHSEGCPQVLQTLWMQIISNCPMGLELFMRCSTNYKQLQTIYFQRRNHRLPEWRTFCNWIESLPYAQQLILGNS